MDLRFLKVPATKLHKLTYHSTLNIDPVLGTIALPVGEGREHLWYKVRAAFRHIHKHYLNEADFFIKADDDSFVITENLRMLLSKHSPNDPNWFGCRFHLPQQHDQVHKNNNYRLIQKYRKFTIFLAGIHVRWIRLRFKPRSSKAIR